MIRLPFALSTALVLLLPAASVSAQSLCHVVHLSVYRVDVSPSQKILDVEPFTTRLLNYGGTFDLGFYAVSVEVGAGGPGAPADEARYCNISANVDFDMDSPGIVSDPMDRTIEIVKARVSGWQFPIVTKQVDSLVGGGFDAHAAHTESLNQQYAVARVGRRSGHSGPISGSMSIPGRESQRMATNGRRRRGVARSRRRTARGSSPPRAGTLHSVDCGIRVLIGRR